jgi:hypothetical protein
MLALLRPGLTIGVGFFVDAAPFIALALFSIGRRSVCESCRPRSSIIMPANSLSLSQT